ncbi:hypothetical protein VNO77_19160 [Canavalia gladiata]|uniref:Uncharacterized protein n=1 Tax=Canavalia gladiata TaxID=3824 RepID=A0AAN9LMV6_CANGL
MTSSPSEGISGRENVQGTPPASGHVRFLWHKSTTASSLAFTLYYDRSYSTLDLAVIVGRGLTYSWLREEEFCEGCSPSRSNASREDGSSIPIEITS